MDMGLSMRSPVRIATRGHIARRLPVLPGAHNSIGIQIAGQSFRGDTAAARSTPLSRGRLDARFREAEE